MSLRKLVPGLALMLIIGHLTPADNERKPVSKADALTAAEKLIKELFKDDYAKKSSADKLALADVAGNRCGRQGGGRASRDRAG